MWTRARPFYRLTIAHNSCIVILYYAEQRGPAHQVVEVKAQIIIFRERVEIRQIQREQVGWRHAPDVAHCAQLTDG
jgi:hypothetical protein